MVVVTRNGEKPPKMPKQNNKIKMLKGKSIKIKEQQNGCTLGAPK